MKLKTLTLSISLVLAGCSLTSANTSTNKTTIDNNQDIVVQAQESSKPLLTNVATITGQASEITLEKIMSDPDWMGRSAENWYWGDDNQSVLYSQKRLGNEVRDLWLHKVNEKDPTKVSLSDIHQYDDKYAVKSADGKHEVYSFEGDLYLKDLTNNTIKQLTRSTAYETNAEFLLSGDIAYQVGNSYFVYGLKDGAVKEIATLLGEDAPENIAEPATYLAKEQHKLIKYIAKKHQDSLDKQNNKQQLRDENQYVVDSRFYFGKDNSITMSRLSPKADKLIVAVAKTASWRSETDIMPNYISSDGNIKAQSARRRVADNSEYQETLFLVDLKTGEKRELPYYNLPGYNDDVLASVRQENYAREGKVYETNRLPRKIALMAANKTIEWNASGSQVAVLLEAWDNKDRWLATVDFDKAALVNQHRLHDDAWVNYAYNEFGWLKNTDTLYYLSEESGYSHLYSKTISGKANQLTSGNYVVSDVTLTDNDRAFIYKANKKHPGIYEIYKTDIATGKQTALTDLGGNNEYQLSPDGSKLLVEHSDVITPPELYVVELESNKVAQRLTYTISEEFLAMPWTAPNVVAVPSLHTKAPIYSRVYLPAQESQTKQKAVMFVHGAGYLQNAHLGWSDYFREFMFHTLLTQKGYVVMDMDYRASKGYGRDWRTAIYRHMGKPEVEDLKDGVNWLVKNVNVDSNRVGVYGGSYGGFLTLMSLFTEPDLFQSGAALRLVSDWAYYNHGYTANILNTPADDAIAYERSSPIYFAEGLSKPLLINAPMVDDNVFFQDTVRLVQRLIELEKPNFETAIFPVEPHGFKQPSSWLDEYRRILKLFETTL